MKLAATVTRWGSIVVIVLVCLGSIAMSILLVRTVGLQYDEALFVNAAIDPTTRQFVAERVGGVPVLLMDYIGALKSWIYTPVFATVGVSIESIRIPAILLWVGSIAICGRLLWTRVRPWVASLAVVLLATEPAFALMSRNDWGPVVISGVGRVVLIAALVLALERLQARWLFVAVAAIALGTFNKLDFAIAAIAIIAAAIVVFPRRLFALFRHSAAPSVVATVLLGGVFAAAYRFMYLRSAGEVDTFDGRMSERIAARIRLVGETFDGHTLVSYMTGSTFGLGSLALPLACVLVLLVVVVAVESSSPRPPVLLPSAMGVGSLFAFVTVAGVATFVGLVLAAEVSGPHHAAALWPYPSLALALGCGYLVENARGRSRPAWVAAGIGGVLVAGALVTQVVAGVGISTVLLTDAERRSIWTMDTEPASAAVEEVGGVVVVADWGLANQLIAFGADGDRQRFLDIWPEARSLTPAEVLDRFDVPEEFLLVYHPDESQIMRDTTAGARRILVHCAAAGGGSDVLYAGDDVIVRDVTCPR